MNQKTKAKVKPNLKHILFYTSILTSLITPCSFWKSNVSSVVFFFLFNNRGGFFQRCRNTSVLNSNLFIQQLLEVVSSPTQTTQMDLRDISYLTLCNIPHFILPVLLLFFSSKSVEQGMFKIGIQNNTPVVFSLLIHSMISLFSHLI